MNNHNNIPVLGIAFGIAANEPGSCMGPIIIQGSKHFKALATPLHWHDMLYVNESTKGLDALSAISKLNERIAKEAYRFVDKAQPFLAIGGDHSSAIGIWSGASSALFVYLPYRKSTP